MQKSETMGFRLEKKLNYEIPVPSTGNNYYKNHSQIDPSHIHRKFKGPLYNEAGKVCIELT